MTNQIDPGTGLEMTDGEVASLGGVTADDAEIVAEPLGDSEGGVVEGENVAAPVETTPEQSVDAPAETTPE